ncbi:MAG TPA: hypothetical protein VN737_04190 [Bryobacteraceae bacterium]|nr:hypothetical protein [Bryobacteraceae bacterium]
MKKLLSLSLVALTLLAVDVNRIRFGSPVEVGTDNSSPTLTAVSLNSSTTFLAWVFPAPKSETITSFLIRQSSVTGTQPQYRVSLQTVDASGNASGTILAAGAYTSAGSGANNLFQTISTLFDASGTSLPSGIAVTRGTYYALVIDPCPNSTAPCSGAATPDASDFTAFTSVVTGINSGATVGQSPYSETWNGTTWTKNTSQPVYGYRTSASTTRGVPIQSIQSTTTNQGAETGILLNLPTGFCSTFQVAGIHFWGTAAVAAKTMDLTVYNGTTVVGATTAIDSDYVRTPGSFAAELWYFSDTTLPTLNCGTTYRIGIAPAGGGSEAFFVRALNFPTAQDRLAFPGGDWFAYTSRTGCTGACPGNTTAWTDDTTTRPVLNLIFADITPPAGSGGQRSYATIR